MKKLFLLILFFLVQYFSFAQHVSEADRKILRQKEDSLKNYAQKILIGINVADRLKADSIFTKILVRALKVPNSFYYSFDSLQTISMLYPPDSSFKIFTWQMVVNENLLRQHGAIQMRSYDGSLKLYPLIDKSDVTVHISDTVGNNFGWIGAIYYKIIEKRSMNQNYYTLLGFDGNNIRSDKKVIEVLTFSNDEPIFGGRYFSFENDKLFKSAFSRYIMEYKKDAGPTLHYDPELDMIVMEHLISESGQPEKKWTYIGDGDYEGFKWLGGKWVHVEKIYHYITPLNQEPVPMPLKDNNGNLLEDKTTEEGQPANGEKPKNRPTVPRKKKAEGN